MKLPVTLWQTCKNNSTTTANKLMWNSQNVPLHCSSANQASVGCVWQRKQYNNIQGTMLFLSTRGQWPMTSISLHCQSKQCKSIREKLSYYLSQAARLDITSWPACTSLVRKLHGNKSSEQYGYCSANNGNLEHTRYSSCATARQWPQENKVKVTDFIPTVQKLSRYARQVHKCR